MDITDEAVKMEKAIQDLNFLLSYANEDQVDELVRLRSFFTAALNQITQAYCGTERWA